MFLVFNKDKAISYVVTVFTVVVLFLTASMFKKTEESVPTSVNEAIVNKVENNIEESNIVEQNKILNNN